MSKIAIELANYLGITTSMLAALLQVTEQTLLSWNETSLDPKKNRIHTLVEVLDFAIKRGVPRQQLISFLHEPSESSNEESPSLLHRINHEQTGLKSLIPIMVDNFIKTC